MAVKVMFLIMERDINGTIKMPVMSCETQEIALKEIKKFRDENLNCVYTCHTRFKFCNDQNV